ncbi:MAG: hypothetical protein OXC44_03865 [Proteobacteria bacterium]|nr:hypothetical protein [Pseudomonadota bacterium]
MSRMFFCFFWTARLVIMLWVVMGIVLMTVLMIESSLVYAQEAESDSEVSPQKTEDTDTEESSSSSGSFWQGFWDGIFSDKEPGFEREDEVYVISEDEEDTESDFEMKQQDHETDANYEAMVEEEVDKVLTSGVNERLNAYENGVGAFLGESHYNAFVGGYYLRKLPKRGWFQGSLGYGRSSRQTLTRKFSYNLTSRFFSGYGRFLYIPVSTHPLYVSSTLGLHYANHSLKGADVFYLDRDSKDVNLNQFSGSIAIGAGFFHVFGERYYFAIDIISLVGHVVFSSVQTDVDKILDDHFTARWNTITMLPPLNVSLGYLF